MKNFVLIGLFFVGLSFTGFSKQDNSDNYLTMPFDTVTLVTTTGERNPEIESTFTLLSLFELGVLIFTPQFLKKNFIKNNVIN